jgi:hypothetical protein
VARPPIVGGDEFKLEFEFNRFDPFELESKRVNPFELESKRPNPFEFKCVDPFEFGFWRFDPFEARLEVSTWLRARAFKITKIDF